MDHVGRETEIEVKGKKYKLVRFTRAMCRKFVDWARTVIPDPFDVLKRHLKDLPERMANKLAKQAYRDSKKGICYSSPQVQELLQSEEGGFKMAAILLQGGQEMTDDEAYDLVIACGLEHGPQYLGFKILECQGITPTEEIKKKVMENQQLAGMMSTG